MNLELCIRYVINNTAYEQVLNPFFHTNQPIIGILRMKIGLIKEFKKIIRKYFYFNL